MSTDCTVVRDLSYEGKLYVHTLYFDDDRIELRTLEDDQAPLLIFDGDGPVWSWSREETNFLGHITTIGGSWVFIHSKTDQVIEGPSFNIVESILDFELTLSTRFLRGQL